MHFILLAAASLHGSWCLLKLLLGWRQSKGGRIAYGVLFGGTLPVKGSGLFIGPCLRRVFSSHVAAIVARKRALLYCH